MYLRPAQGNPSFYRYGDIRAWAAQAIGLEFSFEEQAGMFLEEDSKTSRPENGLQQAASAFDHIFQYDHARFRKGIGLIYFPEARLAELDEYYSAQPVFRSEKQRPVFCGPFDHQDAIQHIMDTFYNLAPEDIPPRDPIEWR
ncbi:hypothetical protein TRM7557_00226 [Tritonibacter multivorans]|uniref:Uncharacterized protein n=2 Tax=Tritonibacter multivorans TaxID=928856 RepID=A0A0P1G0D3_9RHOB|nr:hypothetical protein [Tritonibacter multivorans]MDA7423061.1 hypothetical protein [Tritonibacter multivorans]CUH75111.1 hypothetical protein TRM7557_00226 [Tritonibacter multivorans]SFD80679.1 hypothetical protein SAMN04488049_1349 [Tritonibacter multivorans]